jgi:hypothetical protein
MTILAGLPAKAVAAPITFNFSGTATAVNALATGTFAVGDSLSGSLTYDSTLTDSNVSPADGRYAPLSSLTFTIGTYTATFVTGSGYVDVINGPPGSDQLGFRGDVTGTTVNGFKPFNLQIGLTDSTGSVFGTDALPLSFDTDQFTLSRFFFQFSNKADPNDPSSPGATGTFVQGTLSGSAVDAAVPAPEPATLTLLGLGLAGIALRLRRKRR